MEQKTKLISSLGDTIVNDEELMKNLTHNSTLPTDILSIVTSYLHPQVDFTFIHFKDSPSAEHLQCDVYVSLFQFTNINYKNEQNGELEIFQRSLIKIFDKYVDMMHFYSFVFKNKVFILNSYSTEILRSYDLQNNTLRIHNFKIDTGTTFPTIIDHDGLIYFFGGFDKTDHKTSKKCGFFNLKSRTCHDLPDMQISSIHHSATMDEKRKCIYITGGYSDDQNVHNNLCQILDMKSGKWVKTIRTPFIKSLHSGVVIKDNLYIMGGKENYETSSSVYCYDIINNKWKIADWSLPEPLQEFSIHLTKNDNLILIESLNSKKGLSNLCYHYSFANKEWTIVDDLSDF